MTTLFVSPHFDDAVFSCAGSILAARAARERVVVCSVFTRGPHARTRIAEDDASLAALRVEAIRLGLDDAPLREHVNASFTSLVLDARVRPSLVRDLRAELTSLCASLDVSELWLPLGVGCHVDHRTVFEAAPTTSARTRYYVERPYDFVPQFRALRRRQLEGGAPQRVTLSTLAASITRGGCDAMIDPSERADVMEALRSELARPGRGTARVRFRAIRHPRRTFAAALRAIEAYRSQLTWLGAADTRLLWSRNALYPRHWLEHEAVVRR